MAIRDLPVKYVWVHRGGKTYAQRYHTLPRSIEYRPDRSFSLERFLLYPHPYEMVYSPPHELPARIYPLSAMRDPKQVVQKICEKLPLWMFPTRLFCSERFLKATKQLPVLSDFVAGLYTYGTPEEAYDAIYTVGQHLLQHKGFLLDKTVSLVYNKLRDFDILRQEPVSYYELRYDPSPSPYSVERSSVYDVYLKLDYRCAARYARDWLPLIAEIAARQIARQIVWEHSREKSEPVKWEDTLLAVINEGDDHIATALCFPAVESRVREVLESLGKPEIVRFYEQTVLPACQAHEKWKPDAGELYDKVLSYGDS